MCVELNQLRLVSLTEVGAGQPEGTVTVEEAEVVEDEMSVAVEVFEIELGTWPVELIVAFGEVVAEAAVVLVDVVILLELVGVVLAELDVVELDVVELDVVELEVVDVVDDKHALS